MIRAKQYTLHIEQPLRPSGGLPAVYYYPVAFMRNRPLLEAVCHATDDTDSEIICAKDCDHFRYCEYGREYHKRKAAGLI